MNLNLNRVMQKMFLTALYGVSNCLLTLKVVLGLHVKEMHFSPVALIDSHTCRLIELAEGRRRRIVSVWEGERKEGMECVRE